MQHSRGMLGSALLILACMMQLACAQMPIPPANSECLRRAYDRPQKARPLVRLPKRGKEVVLTFDGGDMRAVMQAAQLCHMEEEIKAQLIAKKKVAWKNPDDFDILIADYVDLMAATSAGTYTMTYLLTTGADIHTEWPQFMTATPGSALGVYQYIWTLGYLLNQSNYNLGSNFSVVGPANAIFLDGFFKRSFGTRTLRSFESIKSGGLWAWTIAPGQSTLTPLSDPKRKMSGVWQNYLNGSAFPHEGQDFYLWQAVRGSTSWPQRVPPLIATTTPESEQQATYAIQDGAITAMEPANVALPHLFLAANLTIDRVAMLSIGTNAVVNYDVNSDWIARTITGPAAVGTAWGASLANRFRTQAVVRAIFQATKSEQNYLRIDNDYTGGATPFCNHLFEGADCARVVAAVSNTNFGNIQTYAWIGEVQAQAYAKQLKRWVKRWVV